jgi:hypothetical protein
LKPHRCTWIGSLVVIAACALALVHAGQAAPERGFTGTWIGTWEGEGQSGGFELTLETSADGRPGGRVAVTGEPAYTASLRTVAFDGARMTARYDFPPEEAAEIVLTATFSDTEAKGTWSGRVKTSGEEIARGTWTVKKR